MRMFSTIGLILGTLTFQASSFAAVPADASPTELRFVLHYFEGRFPGFKGEDSQIPVVIDLEFLIRKQIAAGLPSPKAPSTLQWALGQKGCEKSNYTPRCVADAIAYATRLDSRL